MLETLLVMVVSCSNLLIDSSNDLGSLLLDLSAASIALITEDKSSIIPVITFPMSLDPFAALSALLIPVVNILSP